MGSATPIGECPGAIQAYAEVGRDVDGFFGPCPSAEQIGQVETLNSREHQLLKAAMRERRKNGKDEQQPMASLFCPPDCYGTPDPDDMEGDGSGNTMYGSGGGDYIRGNGGSDTLHGEGGADFVVTHIGNGEVAKGGNDGYDGVVVWGDNGKDYAYGGSGGNDNCFIDGTDEIDSTCEWNNIDP